MIFGCGTSGQPPNWTAAFGHKQSLRSVAAVARPLHTMLMLSKSTNDQQLERVLVGLGVPQLIDPECPLEPDI